MTSYRGKKSYSITKYNKQKNYTYQGKNTKCKFFWYIKQLSLLLFYLFQLSSINSWFIKFYVYSNKKTDIISLIYD